jgi:hypothetical protein
MEWIPSGIVVATFIFAAVADRVTDSLHRRLAGK